MSIDIDTKLIINEIKKYYKYDTDKDFADFLGIKPQTLSSWYSRNSFDIQLVYSKCIDISSDWLLTGKGSMLRTQNEDKIESGVKALIVSGTKGVPFVTVRAVGGFGSESFSISNMDVKEYYVIPKFNHKKVDFMIEVEGSSMYPKYSSGDVVACTILREASFLQWNKTHVVATMDQGILIKRIQEGSSTDNLLMISDNDSYKPFEVPRSQITGIALVVGVIRME